MATEDEIVSALKKTRMRFSPGLEEMFNDDYFEKSLRTIRVALVLGFLLYTIFGVLDYFLAPISRYRLWFIRFAIVCPVLTGAFVLSFFKISRKIMQPVMSFVASVAGYGIIAMIAFTLDRESGIYYYAGLILVIMWTYTFVRLKFIYATITCWTILLGYELAAIFFQKMLSSASLIKVFVNNNFFFIGASIICMFASYLIEFYTRKDFLQRLLIAENQKKIERERDELSLKNTILHNELQMARIIQQKLIPSDNPSSYIYSLYKPMEEVGGDLYDFIKFRGKKHIGIFLSDVSGHGVPAALVTSMIKSMINDAQKLKYDPSKLFSHLNKMLMNMTADNFITAFYGIYNPDTRTLVYSNAGHNPPIVIFHDHITMLDYAKGKSIPLAIADEEELDLIQEPFTNITVRLPENSKLILYTDGLMEASSPAKGSKQYFGDIAGEIFINLKNLPCSEFVPAVYERLKEFRQGDSFSDDICIICVDIN